MLTIIPQFDTMYSSMINCEIDWLYFTNSVYEMANMQPIETGLKTTIHVMHKGGAKHSARVKVSNIAGIFAHDDNFTLTALI